MNIYMAPIEGIGGYIYRNAVEHHFAGADGYTAPFISSPNLTKKDEDDLKPENNAGLLTPQIMTNNKEAFLAMAERLKDMGYSHINLNFGCPSGTVVTKHKGSGALQVPEELHKLLEDIFCVTPLPLSVKTRIGFETADDWQKIMDIYNEYPLESLTIHPRTKKELYSGPIHLDAFDYAYWTAKMPLIYNGEVRNVRDLEFITEKYPDLAGVMVGRGVLRRPWLIQNLKTGRVPEMEGLQNFHDELLCEYGKILSGESHLLFKMKDMWYHFGEGFAGVDKPLKKLKKSKNLSEYKQAVREVFNSGIIECDADSLRDFVLNS